MTQRNQQFGFVNPFGSANTARPARGVRQQQQPQYQQPQFEYEDEQDPNWVAQAYMKIGFRLSNGKVKFLKMGKTDKQLRLGSPLEAMIIDYWDKGGDLNELVKSMVIEINDAQADEWDESVTFGHVVSEEEVEDITPAKPKQRRQRATTPTDEE